MATIKKHIIAAVAIAFLALSGMLVTPLHKDRIRLDLTSEPVTGMGPDVVLLTTALGAFRGIAINVIWIRMESLKQEGKLFEIAQLADLACRLAPRFPSVWDFNAWNMAYNITPYLPPEDRWPWVRQGIELLRDRAIPNNPEEPELYFALGWIYMNKIGDQTDEAHMIYKERLSRKMHEVLDGSGSREILKTLAEAPGTRETLLQNEDVQDFYRSLREKGFDPLRKTEGDEKQIFRYLRNPASAPESAREFMEARANRQEMEAILTYARAARLRDQFNLRPAIMSDMMEEYGPLDWRNPYSHSIYWATLGRRVATAYRDRERRRSLRGEAIGMDDILEAGVAAEEDDRDWGRYRYTDINYERIIYGSLQKLVQQGRLLFDSRGRILHTMGPDYRFTEPMISVAEGLLEKYEEADRYVSGIEATYENFLARATVEFYFMGAGDDSRRYYELLRERFPREEYERPHEEFVTGELVQYVERAGAPEIRNLIRGLLQQSYLYLASDAGQRAEALYERARRLGRIWNERHAREAHRTINVTTIRDSLLSDIFDGNAGFTEELVGSLREQLPPGLVSRIEGTLPEEDE